MLIEDFFVKLLAQFLLNLTMWLIKRTAGSASARGAASVLRECAKRLEPGHAMRTALGATAKAAQSYSPEVLRIVIWSGMLYSSYRCSELGSGFSHIAFV